MPDRDKVIRAIDGCINIDDYCNVCDYDGCVFNHGSCEKDLLADALELLEEKEPMEPTMDHVRNMRCPKCNTVLKGRFCYECGQEVIWHEQ